MPLVRVAELGYNESRSRRSRRAAADFAAHTAVGFGRPLGGLDEEDCFRSFGRRGFRIVRPAVGPRGLGCAGALSGYRQLRRLNRRSPSRRRAADSAGDRRYPPSAFSTGCATFCGRLFAGRYPHPLRAVQPAIMPGCGRRKPVMSACLPLLLSTTNLICSIG